MLFRSGIGPVAYRDRRPLDTDLKNLADACAAAHPGEAFMNAASPGVLTKFVPDTYYKNEDAYVEALADALQQEYEAIAGAGFVLQIDAPDLGSARHNQYQQLSDEEFLRIAERNIAAVNHATRTIPPEAMRLHICWGNYEARTRMISRSPRCSTPACGRGRRHCFSRRPIRATRMNGRT